MHFLSDLHIHSRYSRATSKNLDLESLYQWAQIKGLHVIGTGDFTHPEWIKELQEKLEPDGTGLFRLKNPPKTPGLPGMRTNDIDVRFCLSTEISSIYKYNEKVRKNHNLVYAPDIETAKRINARLSEIGNLASDGRPILGLPAHDLLEIVLETSDDAHLIPAHVWTPWFSTLGSKAGYDSIEECFRDLSEHIFALETGLSSDPEMNWKISALDRYTLISNSDAHSPQKLGREANLFDTERSYYAIFEALKTKKGFNGTYEFFPEEGKYHMDGHRKCNVCMKPHESIKHNEICPVCGKPLTIGVLNRVEKLADREMPQKPEGAPDFEYIIPLPEIISEFTGTGPSSKGVQQNFIRMISKFGNEFDLLQKIPIEEIKSKGGELLAEAIRRLRHREVNPQGGYDGEYGVISIFNPGEIEQLMGQTDLFGGSLVQKVKQRKAKKQKLHSQTNHYADVEHSPNEEQTLAIKNEGNTLVSAGPGTGKTNTLIQWIVYQIEQQKTAPEQIIAITFTNKSADELRERLNKKIGEKSGNIMCGTFHAVAFAFLKEMKPEITTIYDSANRKQVFSILFSDLKKTEIKQLSRSYESFFEGMTTDNNPEKLNAVIETYHAYLEKLHAVDISAIIAKVNDLLKQKEDISGNYKCLAVDEFQDINPVQYEFVQLLGKNKQFFAIGDPNQSIYSFRGADIALFFQPKDDFEAKEICLKKNYRTPSGILKAATTLIEKNQYRAKANAEAVKTSHSRIALFAADDAKQEAKYIAEKILHYIGGTEASTTGKTLSDYNYAFSDIAVLFRTHHIGQQIAQTLKGYGIPVVLSDGTSFLSEPPFNIITSALQLLDNNQNMLALSELLRVVGKLSPVKIPKLLHQYIEHSVTLEAMSSDENWKSWMTVFQDLQSTFETATTGEIMQKLCDFLLPVSILEETDQFKREIILRSAMDWNDSPGEFLHKQILSPYTDAARQKNEGLRLMTFHASKGLEFPIVFIAGAEEEITPVNREDANLEEERRLFYVAMTRTKEKLHLTHCGQRMIFGKTKQMQESRFIKEIDAILLEKESFVPQKKKNTGQQLNLF